MIAMAICASKGLVPVDFIKASLHTSSRMTLPLAPPSSLVLASCNFRDWPNPGKNQTSPIVALSGETLALRSRGLENQRLFESQVILL